MSKKLIILFPAIFCLMVGKAASVWPTSVNGLLIISIMNPGISDNERAIPYPDGKTLVVWDDHIGTDYPIPRYQIIDKYGNFQFEYKQALFDTTLDSYMTEAVSDGAGGAVVLILQFVEGVEASIYIQRLDSLGNKLWGENGIQVAYGNGQGEMSLDGFEIVQDSICNSIFVMYRESYIESGNIANVKIQKYDMNGNELWQPEGYVLTDSGACAGVGYMYNSLVPDYNGGVYGIWKQYFDPIASGDKIFMQHLDSNGNRLWQNYAQGKLIYNPGDDIYDYPEILSDGIGGVYASDTDHIKRYLPDGSMAWQVDTYGYQVFLHPGDADDFYSTFHTDLNVGYMRAQRISRDGRLLWPGQYLQISTHQCVLRDGMYGAFYQDGYLYISFVSDAGNRIISQKVDSSGNLCWGNGVLAAYNSAWPVLQRATCTDQGGGLITVLHTLLGYDLYAKRVRWDGSLGGDYSKIDNVVISMNGNDAIISWPEQVFNARYHIYKSNNPYIVTIPPVATVTDTFYVDTGAVNEGAAFYRVSWELGN